MKFAYRSGASIAAAAATLILAGVAVAPASYAAEAKVFAQDDTMSKDTMGKDTVGKDTMSKDTMGKDAMGKNTMGGSHGQGHDGQRQHEKRRNEQVGCRTLPSGDGLAHQASSHTF